MKSKRVYFPPTTPQQRKLLFEIWEQSKNATAACQKAHVGRATFYYWKARFEKEGYAGLESYETLGAPKGSGRVAAEVERKVLELHGQNEDWGKHRLAHEIAKANNWVPLVSPNTVRRILEDAGMWKPGRKAGKKKSGLDPVSRTAEMPGQTLNVDLCFVPVSHLADIKLPAVSGSSGHLVIERVKEEGHVPDYPGKVFADAELDYVDAVAAFVKGSRPLLGARIGAIAVEKPSRQAEIQQLRQEEAQLCLERGKMRKCRELEDAAWQVRWEQLRCEKTTVQPKLRARWGSLKAIEEQHHSLRQQHRQQARKRQQEDELWRLNRKSLRERMTLLPIVTAWIAILLVTDNCTRQCLGLPLFIAGSHVTAEMVVAALRTLLPANLQFLISDRGIHFSADVFQQFAQESNFVHVVIARHRPQSNGIAERFVRSLKEWLADKDWQSDQGLSEFLRLFLLEYNDRPHQGLPIPGLSPNEYAHRVWLM